MGVLAGPGGPLFARRIVEGLAGWLAAHGADLRPDTRVAEVDAAGGAVTLASGEVVAGDLVVVAAGAWLGGLLPGAAGRCLRPCGRRCATWRRRSAGARAGQRAPAIVSIGDRGTYTLPGVAGTDLKFGWGGHRRPGHPDRDGFEVGADEGERIIGAFRDHLRDADGYRPLRFHVGYYVMDGSRRFRLERSGRALVVTNCDGQMFKFGPLLGERIVACLDGALSATDLARWAAGD